LNSADLPGAQWRKSTYSGEQGDCVEVALLGDGRVAVRDSKDAGDGPVLTFTAAEWRAFAAGMADGQFDRT
jgi:hypothetical protein